MGWVCLRLAHILPCEMVVGIGEKPLPVIPDCPLRDERFDRTDAWPEARPIVRRTELKKDNIHLVPSDSKLEGFVGDDEAMLADGPSRRDELEQVFECGRCWG